MTFLSIIAIIAILAIAYKKEIKSLLSKIKPNFSEGIHDLRHCDGDCSHCKGKNMLAKIVTVVIMVCGVFFTAAILSAPMQEEKAEDNSPVKEVILTVVSKKDDAPLTFLKLSDGHVIKIGKRCMGGGMEDYDSWIMVDKGDKVRKLVYKNKKPVYTPEFEENAAK